MKYIIRNEDGYRLRSGDWSVRLEIIVEAILVVANEVVGLRSELRSRHDTARSKMPGEDLAHPVSSHGADTCAILFVWR